MLLDFVKEGGNLWELLGAKINDRVFRGRSMMNYQIERYERLIRSDKPQSYRDYERFEKELLRYLEKGQVD